MGSSSEHTSVDALEPGEDVLSRCLTAHQYGWNIKLLLQQAEQADVVAAASAAIEQLPLASVAYAQQKLLDLPPAAVNLCLALFTHRKGKGGRQHGPDPHSNPRINAAKAARILKNRRSAAVSKMNKKIDDLAELLQDLPVEQDQDAAAAGSPAAPDAPDAAASAEQHAAAHAAAAGPPGNSAAASPAAAAESSGSHGSAGEGQAGSSSDRSGALPAVSFDTEALFKAAVRAQASSEHGTAQAMLCASAAAAADHQMFEQMQQDDLGAPAGLVGLEAEASVGQQQAAPHSSSQVRLDLQMQQLLQDAAAAGFYRGSPPPALPDTPESLPAGAHLSAQLQAAASLGAGAAGMESTGMAPDPLEPSAAAEHAGWGLGAHAQRRAAARRISFDSAGVNGLGPQMQRHNIRKGPLGGRVAKPQHHMGFHSRVAVLEDMIRTQRRIMGEVLELLNMERAAVGLPPVAFGAGAGAQPGASVGAQPEDSAAMEGTNVLMPQGEFVDRSATPPTSGMPYNSCPAQLETYSSLSPLSSVGLGFEDGSNAHGAGLATAAGGMPAPVPAAHVSAQALGLGSNAAGAAGLPSNGSVQQYGALGAPGMSVQGPPAGILGSSANNLQLRLLRLQQNSMRASVQLQQEQEARGLTAVPAPAASGYAGAEVLPGAATKPLAHPGVAAWLQAGAGSGVLPGSSAHAAWPNTAMPAHSAGPGGAQNDPTMPAHWPAGRPTAEGVQTQLGQFTRRPPAAAVARRFSVDSAQPGVSMAHGILAGAAPGIYASMRPGLKRSSTGTSLPQMHAGSAGQMDVPQHLRAQAAALNRGSLLSDVYASAAAAAAGSFGGPAGAGDTAGLGLGVGGRSMLLQAHSAPLPGSVRASIEGFASGPAVMQDSMRQQAGTPSAQAVVEMLSAGLGSGRLDVFAAAFLLHAQQAMGGLLGAHQASSLAPGVVVGSAVQYQAQGPLDPAHSFTPGTAVQNSQHMADAAAAAQQQLVQTGLWDGAAEGQQLQAAHHAGALQRPANVAVPDAAGDAPMTDGDVHWYDDDVLVALTP